MTESMHNPVAVVLRLAGGAAVALLLIQCWAATPGMLEHLSVLFDTQTSWTEAALTAALAAATGLLMGLLLALSGTAVYRPTRSHLAVAVVISLVWLGWSAYELIVVPAVDAVVRAPYAEGAKMLLARVTMLVSIVAMFGVEWTLSGAAGFRDRRERLWSEPSIRAGCTALAWFIFLAFPHVQSDTKEAVLNVFTPGWKETIDRYGFLLLPAGCIVFAKTAPGLLMKLTGITPRGAAASRRALAERRHAWKRGLPSQTPPPAEG